MITWKKQTTYDDNPGIDPRDDSQLHFFVYLPVGRKKMNLVAAFIGKGDCEDFLAGIKEAIVIERGVL